MEWADPAYLWFAVLALPLLALIAGGARRRRGELTRLAGAGAGARLSVRGADLARGALLWGASLLLVVACCRPQWGRVAEDLPARGVDILIALDTSKSMLADDLKPTRLTAAKEAVAALTAGLGGDRIGLIAFAGSAFLVCPLTSDYGVFGGALAEAGVDSIPLGGTSLSAALKEARRAFSRSGAGKKVLIVVSDGEDPGGDYAAEAKGLREVGVTLYCAGAGTLQGGLIPLARGDFLKDRRGAVVRSRLNPGPLREIAAGHYLDLSSGGSALADLYVDELASLERSALPGNRVRLRERFQIPLALALALLALEPCLGRRGPR